MSDQRPRNADDPAFTLAATYRAPDESCVEGSYPGLTKREYFAASALQALLANPARCGDDWPAYARGACEMADALLEELAK